MAHHNYMEIVDDYIISKTTDNDIKRNKKSVRYLPAPFKTCMLGLSLVNFEISKLELKD